MSLTQIQTLTVFVDDQERARQFYADVLGFEVRTDLAMGDNRWLEVAPPGAATAIVLHRPFPGAAAGTSGGTILASSDLDADVERLRSLGLEPDWAATDHRDPRAFRVAFRIGADYQVFVRFPWNGRTPGELATAVAKTFARHPKRWRATWHGIRREVTAPPSIAGWRWRPERW